MNDRVAAHLNRRRYRAKTMCRIYFDGRMPRAFWAQLRRGQLYTMTVTQFHYQANRFLAKVTEFAQTTPQDVKLERLERRLHAKRRKVTAWICTEAKVVVLERGHG